MIKGSSTARQMKEYRRRISRMPVSALMQEWEDAALRLNPHSRIRELTAAEKKGSGADD